jgi:leucyl aminopeptidase (aminopeptidase T)
MVVDPGLAAAVERLVEGALGVVAGERVVVVHDGAHDALAELAEASIRGARAEPVLVRLEDHGPRPHAQLPLAAVEALAGAQASLLAIDFHKGELAMRTEMVTRAAAAGLRHGHMVGVQRAAIIAGFSVDPRRIAEKTRALQVRLGPTSRVVVRSRAGTDLVVTLAPRCRWLDYGATVRIGKRVNLPGGELVTSPEEVDGVYVADGTLGDADGALRRSLAATPIVLRVARSRVVAVECPKNAALAHTVSRRLAQVANLNRVGMVGFGVNLGLTEPTGDVFADQKVPGVHLSLGETFPTLTGATWSSSSWVAFTSRDQDVDVDSASVLRGGRFLV